MSKLEKKDEEDWAGICAILAAKVDARLKNKEALPPGYNKDDLELPDSKLLPHLADLDVYLTKTLPKCDIAISFANKDRLRQIVSKYTQGSVNSGSSFSVSVQPTISVSLFNAKEVRLVPAENKLEEMRAAVAVKFNTDPKRSKLYFYSVPSIVESRVKLDSQELWSSFMAIVRLYPTMLYLHQEANGDVSPSKERFPALYVNTALANASDYSKLSPPGSSPKTPVDAVQNDAVKERDGHKCVVCGRGGKVCAAHVVHRNQRGKMELPKPFGGPNDVNTMITLCDNCHTDMDVNKWAYVEVQWIGNEVEYIWTVRKQFSGEVDAWKKNGSKLRLPADELMYLWPPEHYFLWLQQWQEQQLAKKAEQPICQAILKSTKEPCTHPAIDGKFCGLHNKSPKDENKNPKSSPVSTSMPVSSLSLLTKQPPKT
jgi:hypothetical protein